MCVVRVSGKEWVCLEAVIQRIYTDMKFKINILIVSIVSEVTAFAATSSISLVRMWLTRWKSIRQLFSETTSWFRVTTMIH